MPQPQNPYASPVSPVGPVSEGPPWREPQPAGVPRERFSLAFVLEEDDWVALVSYLTLASPLARMRQMRLNRGWGLVRGLLVTLPLLLLVVYLGGQFWPGNFAGGGFLETLPIWLLLGFLAIRGLWRGVAARRYVHRYARDVLAFGNNRVLLGPHRLELDARGLQLASEYHQTHLQWEALETAALHGDSLVLMWSPASGFLIPGRAFADRREYDDFVATCRHFAPHLHLQVASP